MKKSFVPIAVSLLMLSGCGRSEGASTSPSDQPSGPEALAEAPAADPFIGSFERTGFSADVLTIRKDGELYIVERTVPPPHTPFTLVAQLEGGMLRTNNMMVGDIAVSGDTLYAMSSTYNRWQH